MNLIFFSTGSNLGDRKSHLHFAQKMLEKHVGKIQAISSIYQTDAWGNTNQNKFLNQVLNVRTKLDAFECLKVIQFIEKQAHRERIELWGPRTLDIDILFFNDEIIATKNLKIPHPFISNRLFVLLPLCEIDADYIHPVSLKKIQQILTECEDQSAIEKLKNEV